VTSAPSPGDALDLLDWRRRVFELYAEVRATDDPRAGWERWKAVRDELFADHPQSPIPPAERDAFQAAPFFEHDPEARVLAEVVPAKPAHFDIGASDGGTYGFTRAGEARFELRGTALRLELYWLDGYAGGLFVPFRDATAGRSTYGAGRYLLDTVKGADLGPAPDGRLILDFNLAYNPSCSYDPRWSCPLAPPANRLDVAVEAGERVAET
jgi:uncharacterized protein (DUF1684 family)